MFIASQSSNAFCSIQDKVSIILILCYFLCLEKANSWKRLWRWKITIIVPGEDKSENKTFSRSVTETVLNIGQYSESVNKQIYKDRKCEKQR